MRRPVMIVAVAGMISAMVPAGAIQAGASPGTVPLHPATARLTGTVNVASLPSVGGAASSMRQLPLRTRPSNSSGSPTAAASAPPSLAPLLSISAGTQLSGALKNSDNPSGLTPPDMGVGADKTHVVQMVNVVGKIWTGSVPGPKFLLSTFFGAGSNFLSDPWVLYDQESGRWFAGIGDFTLGGERIGVSQTGDPTGSWFIYSVQYPGQPGGGCPDQSKPGVDKNVLALGFNEFKGSACGAYLGAGIEVFNKAQMLAGASVNFIYTNPLPQYFSLVPAQALSNGQTTQYFAGNDLGSTSKALHRVTSVGTPPSVTLTALTDLTLAHTYPPPPKAVQKGTGALLNSGDQRMQHVVWKAGVGLLMSWTESCKPATDTAARDCARIIATNDGVGGPAVIKDTDLSKKGQYYVYPAATLNSSNDVVVAFTVSSSTLFPQMDAAAATVSGAFGPPLLLTPGTSANATGRYGDYNAVALDPAGTTPNRNVWAAAEIGGPAGNTWQTAVRQVKVTP